MKLHFYSILLLALGCSFASGPALSPPESKSERLGYSIGYQVGEDFRHNHPAIDVDLLVAGAVDALDGTAPAYSEPEMREALVELGRRDNDRDNDRERDRERATP